MGIKKQLHMEFPDLPEVETMPLPEEPSVEEQIEMATRELEQKNNDLVQQIYYKEQEVSQLRKALEDQANYFDKTVSNLVQSVFGPNNK